MNILTARAGAITRGNTLFLAGVGDRLDWIANLGSTGRRVGRFSMEQYISSEFNESTQGSDTWLGNPQAVGFPAFLISCNVSGLLRLSQLSGLTPSKEHLCHLQCIPAYQSAPVPRSQLSPGRCLKRQGHCSQCDQHLCEIPSSIS